MAASESDLKGRPPIERSDRRCDVHGAYESLRIVGIKSWSECGKCAQEAKEAQRRIDASGLRGRFARASFDSFIISSDAQRQVVDQCLKYCARLRDTQWKPLLLIGPPGTGKTHLGAAIVRDHIMDRRKPAYMASAREIIRDLRSTWRKDSDRSEEQMIESYAREPLLVVDELGVGFGSDGEIVQLLDVIDLRYQMQLPTVFISNLNVPLLRAAIGDRLFDRINEESRVLACNWSSFRQPLRGDEA